jgi:CHAT domain-containing protein/tetratricopeptide (TPR) repeat protein
MGDKHGAIDLLQRALALCPDAAENSELTWVIHSNIGTAYDALGDKQKAIDHFERSLKLFRETGLGDGASATLNNLGLLYSSIGYSATALRRYEQALGIAQKQKDRRGEATTLNNMANTYLRLGERQKALRFHRQALPLRRVAREPKGLATTLANIGNVYIALGQYSKALDYLNEALLMKKESADSQGEAVVLFRMGLAYASMGDAQKAMDHYRRSLPVARSANDRGTESAAHYGLARVNLKLGNPAEALADIETALEIVESLRGKIPSPEMRASYFATTDEYNEAYVDLLMQLDRLQPGEGFDLRALNANEHRRARSLLEMLAEARIDIRHGSDPALLERERLLKQMIDIKTEQYDKLQGREREQHARSLQIEIEDLFTQYQSAQGRIRANNPRSAALTMSRPFTVEEIQKEVLDDDTLLLEYALGDERSYLWVVGPRSVTSFELPGRAEVEKAARRVYDLLAQANRVKLPRGVPDNGSHRARTAMEYLQAGVELARMILSPAASQLGNKRLLIVADGELNYVPFAALPAPWRRASGVEIDRIAEERAPSLILDHEIVMMPSASTLGVLNRELAGRAVPSKSVAVIADPVFDIDDDRVSRRVGNRRRRGRPGGRGGTASFPLSALPAVERSVRDLGLAPNGGLPRLPFTRREANAIRSVAPPEGVMIALDFDSNKALASNQKLKEYRIIHFATHALLNNEHPELSGIVTSLVDRQGGHQDGFIRMLDIYKLDLNADLVVLSGCQTALGRSIKAEGLVGLTRAFMCAGAARVVASLWRVDDEATAELMMRFYHSMLAEGQRPAAALRAAQVWMQQQERWQSPYYWAGFVFQGEWR